MAKNIRKQAKTKFATDKVMQTIVEAPFFKSWIDHEKIMSLDKQFAQIIKGQETEVVFQAIARHLADRGNGDPQHLAALTRFLLMQLNAEIEDNESNAESKINE